MQPKLLKLISKIVSKLISDGVDVIPPGIRKKIERVFEIFIVNKKCIF